MRRRMGGGLCGLLAAAALIMSMSGVAHDTPSSNALNGVSCVTAGNCVAAGSAPDPGGYSATLVLAIG